VLPAFGNSQDLSDIEERLAKAPDDLPLFFARTLDMPGPQRLILGFRGYLHTAEEDFDKMDLSDVHTTASGTQVGSRADGATVNIHTDTDPRS
jgi:hypothetical protein